MGLHYEIDFRTSRQGLTYPFSFEGLLIETNLGSRAWIRVGGKLVKGLDQYSHSGQTLVQRDRDPQYATIDQLGEITNTMASLKDAILGLGKRIDWHQAPPVPIQGTIPHDCSTPPPPPPYGPTIQLNHIVPSPLPPLVQSAPQIRVFVLHGQTKTTSLPIVAPTQVVNDTQAHIERIEQRMRSLHVTDGVMSWDGYDDLQVASLPVEFRIQTLRDT